MATVDTSFYNTRPKSSFEYLQEMDAADTAKQAKESNRLALLIQQGQYQDQQAARQRAGQLREDLQRLGPGATDDQRIGVFESRGEFGQADAVRKTALDRQRTEAQVNKDNAAAKTSELQNAAKQIDIVLQAVSASKDQASYTRAVQFLQANGIDTSNVPPQFDPQAVASFGQMALTAKERVDIQIRQAAADELRRHNRATEENTRRGQNMTDSRAREANDINKQAGRSQVVETPEGVMIVDKGTGEARPAVAGGKPLQAKPSESVKKELVSIGQQRSIVQGAIDAATKTPSAFSMPRGLATMGGAVTESVAGRFDNDAERQARAYVFNNVSKVINERAGAAQSAQELARLRGFLPAETDSSEQIVSKLKAFQTYLGDLESGTTGKKNTGGASGSWGEGWKIEKAE